MSAELNILNKYLKKMYPFITEVESVDAGSEIYDPYTFIPENNYSTSGSGKKGDVLRINIYVSPLHFCELMDDRVEKKLQSLMLKQCGSLVKSIITDCNPDNIRFLFYPDVDKVTIFDNIPEE
jgi:hypothetical protein